MRVDIAAKVLRQHGHICFECDDGLVGVTSAIWLPGGAIDCEDDDRVMEEHMAFPVTDGQVSAKALYAWLGY